MEIRIGRSAHKCHKTKRAFEHGEVIHSLIRVGGEGFVREDYGEDAWEDALADGAYSYWRAQYSDPSLEDQAAPETFSPLRKIFYDAVDGRDRETLAVAYLSAQLLRRQKVFRLLKETDGDEEEARVALFTDRLADRLIEVRDPNLTHEELERGRHVLLERLRELEGESEDNEGEGDSDARTETQESA